MKARMRNNNARSKDQLERMRKLAKNIGCFFCKNNYLKVGASPAIYENRHWNIKKNDYPYEGSVHHYLIFNKRHINRITQMSHAESDDLLKTISWLEKYLKVRGYSVFARSGDMTYTVATIDHLHFHFLVGVRKTGKFKKEDNILVSLGHKKS